MSDELNALFEGLSEEEARQLTGRITAAAKREREALNVQKMGPQIEKYKKDMLAAPRGVTGNSIRAKIKARARAAGVPVDSVEFQGTSHEQQYG